MTRPCAYHETEDRHEDAEAERQPDQPSRQLAHGALHWRRLLGSFVGQTGDAAEPGDLTLYAPGGNLAIFHKDFGYADGLIKLGTIDTDVDQLATLDGEITIELLDREG